LELSLLQRTGEVTIPYPTISVVIPLYNEEAVVPELIRRICTLLDRLPAGPHTALFVDDGSTDGTLQYLESAARADSRLQVVVLSRNFGHQAALTAALDYVKADVIVVMDGDLQDSPEVIPEFIAKYLEGYDVVFAQRRNRQESWSLRAAYFLFYRLLSRLSDVPLPIDAGDFGLMSLRVVEQLRKMPEHHRYLRGLRSWVGFRQVSMPVDRPARHTGTTKYGFWRLLKLASDGIFAFSIVPIRAAALFGAAAIVASSLFTSYAVYARLFLNRSPRGFTALTVLIVFLSGVLLLFLGIIGEYVGRVYEEVKGRPLYVVERLIQCERPPHTFNHGEKRAPLHSQTRSGE
jgi:polyisoprenyl-phosphate glycosyltransferase